MTFAKYQEDLTPIRGDWGLAWARAHGTVKDRELARARDAVLVGAITRCGDDALSRHGADTQIERMPSEGAVSWRARIQGAWESWSWLGTRYGIAYAVGLLGYGHPAILSWRDYRWDADATRWARLRVFFLGRAAWTGNPWGSFAWGGRLAEPIEGVAEETARPQLRRILRHWINARDRVYTVNITFGNTLWGRFRWGSGLYASGAESTVWGPPAWGSDEARWGAFAWGVFC